VEVEYSASFFRYFASQLDELKPRVLPHQIRNCRWAIQFRPAGVAAAITPWNFPLAMIAKKLASAVGAGCGVVVKPARATPLSPIAFCSIVDQIGLPRGLVNLVFGDSKTIADVLCRHPAVRVISFTGSTEVGKELAAAAAPFVKRLTLELGGNAPFGVFADADLDAAADGLIANKFRAGGQTCVCANRVYVHRDVVDAFSSKLAQRMEKLRCGNGLEPSTDIGPLINGDGFDKVASHVNDALQRGATRLVGADPVRPSHDWGWFFPPTLLIGVKPDMRVCCEETFGPVVAISSFSSDEEFVSRSNSTPYGLAAYLFTDDADRARRLCSQLQFGHIAINSGTGPTPEAPFGGMKESGYGREGGLEGLLEFCEAQTVVEA
jgi:succinate-semialdehyde dehydrogenase/glutarate-semialdehyde dehydrogenase